MLNYLLVVTLIITLLRGTNANFVVGLAHLKPPPTAQAKMDVFAYSFSMQFPTHCPMLPFYFPMRAVCPTSSDMSQNSIRCIPDVCIDGPTLTSLPIGCACPSGQSISSVILGGVEFFRDVYPLCTGPPLAAPIGFGEKNATLTVNTAATAEFPVSCGSIPFFFPEGTDCGPIESAHTKNVICEKNSCSPSLSWISLSLDQNCPADYTPAQVQIESTFYDTTNRTICSA